MKTQAPGHAPQSRLCRVQASNNGVRSTACFGKLASFGSIFTQAALLSVQIFPVGSAQSMLSSVPARTTVIPGVAGMFQSQP